METRGYVAIIEYILGIYRENARENGNYKNESQPAPRGLGVWGLRV